MSSRVRYDVGLFWSISRSIRGGSAFRTLFIFEAQDIRNYVIRFRLGKDEVRHVLVIGAEKHVQRKPGSRRHVSDALEARRSVLVDRQSLTSVGKQHRQNVMTRTALGGRNLASSCWIAIKGLSEGRKLYG